MRHAYLQNAPVLRALAQHFNLLPPKLKASNFSNGPFTCTHHAATFCLQNNHQRKAHLRQLAYTRYHNLSLSKHNADTDPAGTKGFTQPTRLVGPHQLPSRTGPDSQRRHSLTVPEITSFLQSSLPTTTWTQSPTTPCRIFSTDDNTLLR